MHSFETYFLPTSASVLGCLFCLFLYLILQPLSKYLITRQRLRTNFIWYRLTIILIIIFCLFPFWGGDWYHYFDAVTDMQNYDSDIKWMNRKSVKYIELPYWKIAQFVKYLYIPWRFVVWGGAFFCFLLIIKRLQLDRNIALFSFVTVNLLIFSYARVSLAMVMCFLGFSFICKKKNLLHYAIGILLIYFGAIYFHKSATFMLFILPLSLINLNKRTLKVILISLPILFIFINFIINYATFINFSSESIFDQQSLVKYYEGEHSDAKTLGGKIQFFITSISLYGTFLLIIFSVFDGLYKQFPVTIKKYMNSIIWIIIISTGIGFITGFGGNVLYYRLLYFSTIPVTIVLTFFLSLPNYRTLYLKRMISIAIFSNIYTLLYATLSQYNMVADKVITIQ